MEGWLPCVCPFSHLKYSDGMVVFRMPSSLDVQWDSSGQRGTHVDSRACSLGRGARVFQEKDIPSAFQGEFGFTQRSGF